MMNTDQWKGRTVCFLGDSITDGVAVEKGERYLDLLGEKLGFHAVGYGVNGARFAGLMSQIDRMDAEHAGDVDAIFVFAGTNDYNGSLPLGEWYSVTEETVTAAVDEQGKPAAYKTLKKRAFNTDLSTFKGCINAVLMRLKHQYADRQIILMTPIHRAWATFSTTNIQYPELYSNSLGLFAEEYVRTIREAASIWSCPLIDLWQDSGLLPILDENASLYFASTERDRLHPNRFGQRRMAELIECRMRTIPVLTRGKN